MNHLVQISDSLICDNGMYRSAIGRNGVGGGGAEASVLDVQSSCFYYRKLDLCHDQTSC